MAIKPKLPVPESLFTLFKRGVEASAKETKSLARAWDKNLEKTFGDVPKDWDDNAVRVNKEFALVKQKQSQLFFRVPEVQLKPLRPDAEVVSAIAAAALNQVLAREMRVSYMVDEVLTDALCPAGIGVSKISYEAITSQVDVKPPEHAETPDEVFQGLVDSGAAAWVKQPVVTYECYDWVRVPYKHFLFPTDFDGSSFDDAPWLGITFTMPKTEAKRLYKLSKDELEQAGVTPNEDSDRDGEGRHHQAGEGLRDLVSGVLLR